MYIHTYTGTANSQHLESDRISKNKKKLREARCALTFCTRPTVGLCRSGIHPFSLSNTPNADDMYFRSSLRSHCIMVHPIIDLHAYQMMRRLVLLLSMAVALFPLRLGQFDICTRPGPHPPNYQGIKPDLMISTSFISSIVRFHLPEHIHTQLWRHTYTNLWIIL